MPSHDRRAVDGVTLGAHPWAAAELRRRTIEVRARLRLIISEQDRRQPVARVTLDMVRRHAPEHARFHAMSEPGIHGPHLQIDTFERAEGPVRARFL